VAGGGDGAQAANLPNPPTALGDPAIARQAVPASWYGVVTQGRLDRFMPPFNSLTDAERWNVVAYALSLSQSTAASGQGKAVYEAQCANCHGPAAGGGESGPDLTAGFAQQSRADLASVVRQGAGELMPAFEGTLPEDDIWAVTDYVQSLAFTSPAEMAAATASGPTAPAAAATEGASIDGTPQAAASPVAARGRLFGEVSYGSPSGEVPDGLQVTVHGLEGDQEVFTATTILTPEKTYAFDELEVVPGRLYYVTADVEGVTYPSEAAHLLDTQTTLELPLVIYAISPDDTGVRVSRLHLLADFSVDGMMQVVELWIVSNVGGTTVAPVDGVGGLRVALPQDASGLRFQEGEALNRYQVTDEGFVDTLPLLPGEGTGQIVFSYNLPYDGSLDFRQPLGYPVVAAVLLMPENGVRVEADGLQDLGLRQVAEGTLHNYSLGPLEAGADLALRLRGAPNGGAAANPNRTLTGIAVGGGVLGIALILAGLFWFRWSAGESARRGTPSSEEADRQALVRAIAALDDERAAGKIGEAAYQSQREALKARLISLMRAPRD
jgi:mono/diheme cytochrome c family protein